jgi:hypothetical protein
MATIIGISGSPRRGLYAHSFAMPDSAQLQIRTIRGICGHPARLRRQASRADRGFTGGIWHHPSQNAWLPVLRRLGAEFWSGAASRLPFPGCLR